MTAPPLPITPPVQRASNNTLISIEFPSADADPGVAVPPTGVGATGATLPAATAAEGAGAGAGSALRFFSAMTKVESPGAARLREAGGVGAAAAAGSAGAPVAVALTSFTGWEGFSLPATSLASLWRRQARCFRCMLRAAPLVARKTDHLLTRTLRHRGAATWIALCRKKNRSKKNEKMKKSRTHTHTHTQLLWGGSLSQVGGQRVGTLARLAPPRPEFVA